MNSLRSMEMMQNSAAMACGIIIAVATWVFVRVLDWVWLRPKRLEESLRQLGLSGTSYKPLSGDLKDNVRMMKEAASKPIGLSNDIVPRVLPHIHNFVNSYGKNFFVWLGPIPSVHILEPELVKEIFSNNFKFPKVKTNPLMKLVATGVAVLEGEKWAKHRKIINPAFHIEKLKHMIPAIYSSTNEVMSQWNTMISSKGSCELDVCPYLETLTSDVISRTAFGSSYEEGRKIFRLQKEQGQLAFQILTTVYVPGWRFLPTKRNKRMKEINKQLRASLMGIINKRVMAMEVGEASNEDLLGIMLESNSKEIKQNGNNKGVGMSIEEVIEECKLFYFAGQETTSILLTWTMILLSWHQNWQQKARDEVTEIFGGQTPTFDGLNRLKIVTSILYEVLRLYPPFPQMNRSIDEETKLGGLSLPAGVQISLPILLLHYDHDIWGDDVKEFKPERFFEGVSKATKNQFSYFPFGWGPRICIGQNFTMLEAKVVLAMILQRFTFKLSPSYSHAPHSVILLKPQHGAHLILHKI